MYGYNFGSHNIRILPRYIENYTSVYADDPCMYLIYPSQSNLLFTYLLKPTHVIVAKSLWSTCS